jgi:hypothetical protein
MARRNIQLSLNRLLEDARARHRTKAAAVAETPRRQAASHAVEGRVRRRVLMGESLERVAPPLLTALRAAFENVAKFDAGLERFLERGE